MEMIFQELSLIGLKMMGLVQEQVWRYGVLVVYSLLVQSEVSQASYMELLVALLLDLHPLITIKNP
jgi:hypothetical protein